MQVQAPPPGYAPAPPPGYAYVPAPQPVMVAPAPMMVAAPAPVMVAPAPVYAAGGTTVMVQRPAGGQCYGHHRGRIGGGGFWTGAAVGAIAMGGWKGPKFGKWKGHHGMGFGKW